MRRAVNPWHYDHGPGGALAAAVPVLAFALLACRFRASAGASK